MPNDIRTKAIVLRRTKYGETDRILNLLTPEGNYAVLAKGVRKEKSRLAGGIEMFCLSEVTLHEGRGKLATLTSAKMLKFYKNLLTDLDRLEFASNILKDVNKLSDQVSSPELFELVNQSFAGLNGDLDKRPSATPDDGQNLGATKNSPLDLRLTEAWYRFNLARIASGPMNLHFDTAGAPLKPNETYSWDTIDLTLTPNPSGNISADHIKLMRLMHVAKLDVLARVKNSEPLLDDILYISRQVV